jgi:alcohol dehydrogenase
MKALVFGGPGQRSWDTTDDPGIVDPADVIVKIDTATICGTDLQILKGDVPAVTEGRILGHEAVGTVVEVGPAVASLKKGDHVLVPAITSCGRCDPCKRGMPAHLPGGDDDRGDRRGGANHRRRSRPIASQACRGIRRHPYRRGR